MMNPDLYRQMNRDRGQPYRWWKAHRCYCWNPRTGEYDRDCPDCSHGFIYEEQSVDAAWKCLVWDSEMEISDHEFGPLPIGTAMISVMPDETPLSRYDRIGLPLSPLDERPILTRASEGAGLLDTLPFQDVSKIEDVRRGLLAYRDGTDYQLTGNSIEWLVDGNQPDDGLTYSLRVFYEPRYLFLGNVKTAMTTDETLAVAGNVSAPRLPLHGALILLRGDEE